jgi:hypothetical protein
LHATASGLSGALRPCPNSTSPNIR